MESELKKRYTKGSRMRFIKQEEKKKRGCEYCLHCKIKTNSYRCPYDKCPYRELDGFKTYSDFMKSKPGLSIDEILKKGSKQ